jgi:hypothetical protein
MLQKQSALARIYSTSFSLLLMNRPNNLVLHYTRLERLDMDKHSNLQGCK